MKLKPTFWTKLSQHWSKYGGTYTVLSTIFVAGFACGLVAGHVFW